MSVPPQLELLPADCQARCLGCGYALRGLIEPRCPECGRAFDPNDPTTYSSETRLDGWRLLRTPPGPFSHYGALAVAVVLIINAAWPGDTICIVFPAALAGLALGAIWLSRALFCLATALMGRRDWSSRPDRWQTWLALPVIVALTAGMLWARVPFHLTFLMSRPAMDRWAVSAMQAPVGARLPDTWAGLYPACEVERFPGGVRFFVRGTGFIDREGWAYSPNGPPPATHEDSYMHFAGPWYLWHWWF